MAGVALLCACHKSENEQIFDKLDRVIAKKHLYEERFVRHADSLRRELRAAGDDTLRWQTANRLFDSYITYNIDTAARYAGLMHNYADATGSREMKFLSTTCDVSVLIARNNIEEAYERILSLDTVGITRRMRATYSAPASLEADFPRAPVYLLKTTPLPKYAVFLFSNTEA